MTNISQKWLNGIKILVPFTTGYNSKINGSELAKINHLPQKTVSRKLNWYCEMKFLKFKREGRNKLYYFDLDNASSKILIKIIELYKGLNFLSKYPKIHLLINDLLKISPVILFGSYVKGYATKESDIDLLIIGKSSKRVKDTIKGYPFKINAHYSTLENFEKLLHRKNTLAREIAKNHIIFSGCEEFVKILMRYYQ
tara:strand:+ start:3214 stop:3804 length:591 start_codon:yes stop_codon:yes gene_type:complete